MAKLFRKAEKRLATDRAGAHSQKFSLGLERRTGSLLEKTKGLLTIFSPKVPMGYEDESGFHFGEKRV